MSFAFCAITVVPQMFWFSLRFLCLSSIDVLILQRFSITLKFGSSFLSNVSVLDSMDILFALRISLVLLTFSWESATKKIPDVLIFNGNALV